MSKTHKIKTEWKGDMAFDSHHDQHIIRIDTKPPMGNDTGTQPKSLMLSAFTGCTGLDVVSLLNKMRVEFDDFYMEVEAPLTDEVAAVYTKFKIDYYFSGKNLKKEKIEKAVKMSQDKYCGVTTMLKMIAPIEYHIHYNE